MKQLLYLLILLFGFSPNLLGEQDQCPILHVDELPARISSQDMVDLPSHIIVNQVCERLIKKWTDGSFVHEAASNWEFNQSGTSLVIWLKNNRFIRVEEVVTADHVKQMIEAVLKAGVVHGFKNISGSSDYLKGLSKHLRGIKVLSKFKIRLEFSEPYFSILDDLSDLHSSLCIQNGNSVIGSGPYYIHATRKNLIELRARSKNISGPNKFCVSDKFQNGVFLSVGNPSDQEAAKKGLRAEFSFFSPEVRFIGFNLDSTFSDIRKRRAILKLFNKSKRNFKYQLGGFIPLGLIGHNPKLNLDTKGQTVYPSEIVIDYYLEDLDTTATSLCKEARAQGLLCTPNRVLLSEFFKLKESGKLKVFLGRFFPSIPSTRDLISVFKPDSKLNYFFSKESKSKHKRSITNYMKLIFSADSTQMAKAVKDFDAYLVENLIMAPIEYGVMQKVVFDSKYIEGGLTINSPMDLEIEKLNVKNTYLYRN